MSAHFDYGWLHPDQDASLKADGTVQGSVLRAQHYLQTISGLPTDVITWNDIYTTLNITGTAGFDIVHPDIEVTINDPAALASLKSGGGILFSVGIGPDPVSAVNADGIYELKVNGLRLELTGASKSSQARLWIQHSGHWIMNSRRLAVLPRRSRPSSCCFRTSRYSICRLEQARSRPRFWSKRHRAPILGRLSRSGGAEHGGLVSLHG